MPSHSSVIREAKTGGTWLDLANAYGSIPHPVDIQSPPTLPCKWSYTESHHQLRGWNSAPVYCWRPVDQLTEVGERDCHRMCSISGTAHHGNEPVMLINAARRETG